MAELTFLSINEHPELARTLLEAVQANSDWRQVSGWLSQRLSECGGAPLPQVWLCRNAAGEPVGYYALSDSEIIRGCPPGRAWLGILLIFDAHRGRKYSPILLEHACAQARACGFPALYLVTEHVNYYERFGFDHIGGAVYEDGSPTKVYRRLL